MKLIIAAFVFFLTLTLTYKVTANTPESCSPSATEHCVPATVESHASANHEKNSAAHGDHNALSTKMNSLFPEKQKDPQVATRPLQVKLETPKFLEVVDAAAVKLDWSNAAGATNYHLQVATDPNFKWLVVNDHWVKDSAFLVTKLEAGKRYFWRVAAVKEDNISMLTKSLFVGSSFTTK